MNEIDRETARQRGDVYSLPCPGALGCLQWRRLRTPGTGRIKRPSGSAIVRPRLWLQRLPREPRIGPSATQTTSVILKQSPRLLATIGPPAIIILPRSSRASLQASPDLQHWRWRWPNRLPVRNSDVWRCHQRCGKLRRRRTYHLQATTAPGMARINPRTSSNGAPTTASTTGAALHLTGAYKAAPWTAANRTTVTGLRPASSGAAHSPTGCPAATGPPAAGRDGADKRAPPLRIYRPTTLTASTWPTTACDHCSVR